MIFLSATSNKKVKIRNATKYLVRWNGKSRSKIQEKVKQMLYEYWYVDVVFEEFPVVGTRMTIDFYNSNKRIALEVDGQQHNEFNKFFHGNSRQKFLHQLCRDDLKEKFCDKNDIKLVRILYSDLLNRDLLKHLELI